MKLVHYIDHSKTHVVEGKEYYLNYYMLEFTNDNDRIVKLLFKPINKSDYQFLNKMAVTKHINVEKKDKKI